MLKTLFGRGKNFLIAQVDPIVDHILKGHVLMVPHMLHFPICVWNDDASLTYIFSLTYPPRYLLMRFQCPLLNFCPLCALFAAWKFGAARGFEIPGRWMPMECLALVTIKCFANAEGYQGQGMLRGFKLGMSLHREPARPRHLYNLKSLTIAFEAPQVRHAPRPRPVDSHAVGKVEIVPPLSSMWTGRCVERCWKIEFSKVFALNKKLLVWFFIQYFPATHGTLGNWGMFMGKHSIECKILRATKPLRSNVGLDESTLQYPGWEELQVLGCASQQGK